MKIIYLGYNSFVDHKRGVENVIDFQSHSIDFEKIYYLHWGNNTSVKRHKNLICISVKHCWYWPLIINILIWKLKSRNGNDIIIHSHNPLYTFFGFFKTQIFTVHDGLYYLNKSKRRKFTFHFKVMEKIIYKRVKIVHFISNYSKEESLFGNNVNYVIIPNTSHFEQYQQEVTCRVNIFKNTSLNVLIVRSIEERARFDLLLKVAERLKNKSCFFTVAGKGPLLDYFQNEITKMKLTNIVMLGYVDDKELLQLYSESNIVLMIAEYGEGFGLPIIEGYLFNKPVIASNKCAIPEVIISKDFLFDNNVDSIIHSLEFATENSNMNFREFYDTNFSNSIVLYKLKNVYINCFS